MDHFVLAVRIAGGLLGKRTILPRASRSAARGAVCSMSLPVYLVARVIWEAHPVVAAALEDHSVVVIDHCLPTLALALARAQYKALSKAVRFELRDLTEDDEIDASESPLLAS